MNHRLEAGATVVQQAAQAIVVLHVGVLLVIIRRIVVSSHANTGSVLVERLC